MSNPLSHYKDPEDRAKVINRRLKKKTKGLGYLAAKAASRILKRKAAKEAKCPATSST